MARVVKEPNIDDLLERYLSGEGTKELAHFYGVSRNTIARRLNANGITLRGRKINIENIDKVVARYLAGESEKSLAKDLGVSRPTLRANLEAAGVTPRNRSDGMVTRWAMTDDAGRARMLNNAHATNKGRKIPVDAKIKHAMSVERKGRASASVAENVLADTLSDLGWTITQQKAIWIYNIDIAVNEAPLAVEVFGGGWHFQGRHRARFHQRTEHILNSGWHVLIVWIDGRRHPLSINCANYIHTFAQELCSNPSSGCQYRVVLGNGEVAPIRKAYLNTPADIERFGHAVNATGGEHQIPR